MAQRIKEPVRLRERKTSTGLRSLYLDIYFEGERSYEYLHLYLIPEETRADKVKNAETMSIARDVLAKRLMEFRSRQFDMPYSQDIRFFDYAEDLIERLHIAKSTEDLYRSVLIYLHAYEPNGKILISKIDKRWCEGFRKFIEDADKLASESTKAAYFTRFKTILSYAVKDEVLYRNPAIGVKPFHKIGGEREYLTIDELRRLIETPMSNEKVCRPFLFSCLTGMRLSDIRKLTWDDVIKNGDFTRVVFCQQKTRKREYLDINEQAAELMGERPKDGGHVFSLGYISYIEVAVDRWVKAAGIGKHITFHSGRHTFATMMLDLGNDLYTVSKLLGHRNIQTTQIYATILDKNKQAAVSKIPNLLK